MKKGLLNLNEPPGPMDGDGRAQSVMLMKDNKPICRAKCFNIPPAAPNLWTITKFNPSQPHLQLDLPRCKLYPEPENSHQSREWKIFLNFLRKYRRVAIVNCERWCFYLLAPDDFQEFTHAIVQYEMRILDPEYHEKRHTSSDKIHGERIQTRSDCRRGSLEQVDEVRKSSCSPGKLLHSPTAGVIHPNYHFTERIAEDACSSAKAINISQRENESVHSIEDSFKSKFHRPSVQHYSCPTLNVQNEILSRNFVRTDPSYLKTLSQTHAGWIFGAIAELIDNSRDANATRLDLFIECLYFKRAGKKVPVLSVVDNGQGMSHVQIMRMLSFGHKQPEEDSDKIGRFGIGFKTGAMKLGRDVLVLTQTLNSRSIALLSQSYNEEKDNLEIPIVTYFKHGRFMEVDLSIQSNECAISCMNAVKEFSPFNEYYIGEKFGTFGENGTGSQIYIWNLDQWGSNYTLEWENGSSSVNQHRKQGDILIRSRRVRSRPGQLSQKVPLDYSLQAYLEVIFLNPQMKIYVQGSKVKCRPLAKFLNKTVQIRGQIMGRDIELTLGRSKEEWERMNGGMFLYWHGRLIEAYKRVGGQVHSADMGRGVIGVIDVTNLMDGCNESVLVLNNKQGFQDSEAYAKLEEWLGVKSDEYWDTNFDATDVDVTLLQKKGDERYKPDNEWVQCSKCCKWRILDSNIDTESLPTDWFCFMPPFNGKCEIPERQLDRGVITIATKRSRHDFEPSTIQLEKETKKKIRNSATKDKTKQYLGNVSGNGVAEDDNEECFLLADDNIPRPRLRRLQRGTRL